MIFKHYRAFQIADLEGFLDFKTKADVEYAIKPKKGVNKMTIGNGETSIRLDEIGGEEPICPSCGRHNAMLSDYDNCYEGKTYITYGLKCRGCGYKVDYTYTLRHHESYKAYREFLRTRRVK